MSYTQFGYPYTTTTQVSSTPGSRVATGPATPPPLHPSAVAAPTVCCSPYNSRLLASAAARGDLTALGVYGGSYAAAAAAQGYGNYVPYGAEPSAFYSPLTSPYEIKDSNGSLHTGLPQATGYYHYDGAINQYQYSRYGGVDLSAGTRRKNATRETTATLKAWLYEHRKNPYPTKGEKIMLAIITKMTLTQVSTWFANARRRLKKENKMTWSPRSRPGDESGGKDECRRDVDREQQQQQEEEDEEQEAAAAAAAAAAVVVDKRGVVKCFVSDHNGEKEHGKGHVLSDLEDLDDVDSDHLGDDELEEGGHLQAKRFHKSQCKNYPPLAVVDASSINTSSIAASNTSTTNNNNNNIISGGGGSGVQQTSEGIKSVFALSCGEPQDNLQLYDSADQQQQHQQQQHHHHHHQHHHQHHQVVSGGAKSLLPIASEKPRIWSLAHTVSSCDSKYPSCAALQQLQQQQQQSPLSGSQATAGTLLQRHQKFHATLSQLSPPCSEPVGSWRQVAAAASPEELLLKAAEQNGLGSYLLAQQQQQQQQQQQLQQQQLQQQQQQQQQQQLAQVQHGLLSRASCQMSGLHMGAQQHQELTSAKSQAAVNSHRHSTTEVDAIRSKIQGTETGFAWSARP
ncbi:unnamed protein product [Lampetra planeri]